MRVLGVIPARAGSKGAPRKNLRPVAGQPLIAYAIEAALASRLLTAFVTTTEDEEIAAVARQCGSSVVRRPRELAQDETPVVPVLLHALEQAEQEAGAPYDAVILLQPTAPLRSGGDIDAVIGMFAEDPHVESIVSVCAAGDAHPARMYRRDAAGWLQPLWPEWESAQRQQLPEILRRNGAIYAVRRRVLVEQRTVMGQRKKAYVMPWEQLANVDDERDLLIADALMRAWKQEQA